jgi:hypothetical protein
MFNFSPIPSTYQAIEAHKININGNVVCGNHSWQRIATFGKLRKKTMIFKKNYRK